MGYVALNACLLAVGWCVLCGLGLVRDSRSAVRHTGTALVTGWALVGVLLSLALAVGIGFGWATIAAVLLVPAAAGLAAARVVPPRVAAAVEPERGPARLVAGAAAVGVFALLLVLLVRAASPTGILYVDVWNFWLTKAKSIFAFHGLATGPGGITRFENPDYPPLYPAFTAVTYRFLGTTDTLRLPLEHTLLGIGFVLAVAALLHERVRPLLLWPGLLLLLLVPTIEQLIGSLMADEPLAVLFALAGVCGALWALDGDARLAALCGLFLAASTLTKNEGLMLSVALLVPLLLARRPRPSLLLSVVPALVAFVVWKLWLDRHGVPSSSHYRFSDLASPSYLHDNAQKLTTAAGGILKQALHPQKTLLALPLAWLLSMAAPRRIALLAPLAAVLTLAGYSVIYWISPIDVHFYLKAAPRIVTAPVLLCAALLPLLLAEAMRASRSGGRSPSPEA
jgi:hypothetical protein